VGDAFFMGAHELSIDGRFEITEGARDPRAKRVVLFS